MNIGFDAKRAYHNTTGLGNYSRTLIQGLATFFPQHRYYLFNPKPSLHYQLPFTNVHEVLPKGIINKNISSLWRSSRVKSVFQQLEIQLYHGLSHEIPLGIKKTGVPSIVTIHDLIFERYPEQFNKIDISIYRKKFKYACLHSDKIIAISQQTKNDIIDFYGIDELKIDICYQSCHPAFAKAIDDEAKETLRKKYNLPQEYFLYVGSIIERKNLLNICKALLKLKPSLKIPLVIIGDGKKYKKIVKDFIASNDLENEVIFLPEKISSNDKEFQQPGIMAAMYQMAVALIYPSFFEGFGIPVLEGLWSKIPVITSNTSCLPEAGGDGAYYVNPSDVNALAEAMQKVYIDDRLRNKMIEQGWQHAQKFTLEKCTAAVMNVYKKVV